MLLYNFRSEATEEHQHWLVQIGLAFCMQGTAHGCLIAHDSRPASLTVALALMQATTAAPIPSIYLGQCSTPAVAFACRRMRQQAIVVTASHNAWEQVGLKLFDICGLPLSPASEDALALWCFSQATVPSPFSSTPIYQATSLPVLQEYVDLLTLEAGMIRGNDLAIEVGSAWKQTVQRWLLGLKVQGARRTDPSSEPPALSTPSCLFRVDEDLDKLVVWVSGREVPGQLLLVHWLLLRPVGTLCLSFDVTRFAQRYLEQRGYTIAITPVGDQFVAHAMAEYDALTGGEPNGHYIAAERSFCPDALASALDLAGGSFLLPDWYTPAAYYCRGVLAPFPWTLQEAADRLQAVPLLHRFQFSFPANTTALEANWEEQRMILRLSRFEQVAVLQTEGSEARSLFTALAARFESSISRRDSWTE